MRRGSADLAQRGHSRRSDRSDVRRKAVCSDRSWGSQGPGRSSSAEGRRGRGRSTERFFARSPTRKRRAFPALELVMSSPQPPISGGEILDGRVELEPQLLPALPIERILHACRLLWEERRFCLRLLLVALVGSIVVSLLLPPTYESNAVLIPSEPPSIGAMAKMGSLGNIASLAAGGGELMGMRAPEARFIAVLRSRTVADRLIDRFGLMTVYGTSLREGAWQALANHTVIIADRKTGLIFLTLQ